MLTYKATVYLPVFENCTIFFIKNAKIFSEHNAKNSFENSGKKQQKIFHSEI